MITEFKSKEQLAEEKKVKLEKQIDEMLKERPGLQTERLIRLLKGGDLKDDRLYISNGLVKLKFGIRKVYKELDDFYIPEINRVRKILEDKKLSRRFKEDYKNYLEELNQYRDSANSYLMDCGATIIDSFVPMLDKYFTEHEIIQIIGGSYEQAKRIKEWRDKNETGNMLLTESLIMHHVEYRWRKGRGKDYLTCPRWEMPLFECVSSYVWDVINSDPKADMDKVFEDIFGEAMVYTTTDSQGNIISTEKVIQKLTINELIKDYQGPFINQLKQQDTFDNKTTYRIKRVDVGVYDVITEDKEVLDRIYKKQA
ncbi:hypothetical protein [Clostridium neonatale]|uniref:hypothetical protein n=1 Tax=Clostridium neonatale TaxID=137838 RepID=UPI00291BDB31|nr:hypothetical protein [Clostridium neonatale]CAI3606680.1 Conserved hypothetical protein [Clostridium neonatale]CAI3636225.1 Conserved hypothetical protein [Clostridium neonatale]CAI3637752.1 Conserved hypothetical protein [Clostridium neonatale]CAI3638543.1 Conserved hypothetical protein [Clostridium neonatale]CAI3681902.1 Conserved hypothetical protein [Clostridium neonatale]